ncbi:S8 family serine peptidase [Aquimarina algiphila]|uniref:S8 family serine peptidase n=1 Tax=Aquimarina algiphila TaxID=2047982 RepID=UPI00232F7709|nr:S8 family serine peptidase [Aquimarina algiphila]
MKLFPISICVFFLILSCKKEKYPKYKTIPNHTLSLIHKKNKDLTENELYKWHIMDVLEDTIPGISLQKAYSLLEEKEVIDTIVVAVIDSPIDINHEDLKPQIWCNKDEIPDNNIDDDHNGYIDDIHGWNFLGNRKGQHLNYANYESVRIIRRYDSIFRNKTISQVPIQDTTFFLLYHRAKQKLKEQKIDAVKDQEYGKMLENILKTARKTLSLYFPNNNYSIKELDSLKQLYSKDTILQDDILRITNFIKYGFTENYIKNYNIKASERINNMLNIEYYDRTLIGDDSNSITDTNYGNKIVDHDLDIFPHSTIVSGIIGATRNNNIGIDGITNAVKIMPLCISGFGNEHDKDIALAIRYAVDNGAKVINMSFGKEFSARKQWVNDAYKYAEKNNVLIVSSAGNNRRNLNKKNDYYPNDNINNKEEVCSNFILVGASSYSMNKKLITSFSNYGNINVDIFAPGHKIKTLLPKNHYKSDSGTSISSAIVTGIIALIRSYYPDLTATEIKQILMKSGNSYLIDVEIKQKDGSKKIIAFSELSKSGKIVNVYNAILMAEQISDSR